MKVKKLKELLSKIPDDYEIRSRSQNAHLNNDEMHWQLNFSDVITKVKALPHTESRNVDSWM